MFENTERPESKGRAFDGSILLPGADAGFWGGGGGGGGGGGVCVK